MGVRGNPQGLGHQRARCRVFIGGPIVQAIVRGQFDTNLKHLISAVVAVLAEDGFEVASAHVAEQFGQTREASDSHSIVARDFNWMTWCDAFVAVLPAGADGGVVRTDGTHVELGWASALRKNIIVVSPVPVPASYGHMIRGLSSFPQVAFLDIDDVRRNPRVLTDMLQQVDQSD
jgi:hypothetical protein